MITYWICEVVTQGEVPTVKMIMVCWANYHSVVTIFGSLLVATGI